MKLPPETDEMKNTRTTTARWWERLLIAPNCVNFHLEHHLLPTVPHYNLRRMHRMLRKRGALVDAMQLPFEAYAADPDVRGPARNATHDALRRVIDYYLYRDLQRGWRVTAPNLEDCGLLSFD